MNIETEDHYINIDRAISCGLILNELLTNSLKYAFPGDRTGVISVRMSVAYGRCIMVISDDGIGFPEGVDFRNTATPGMQLIVMLTSQIDGTIELDRSAGTRFTIRFPA
jgi:two-component sensor histidine kinase